MEDLQRAIDVIRAAYPDNPTVNRLLLDLWALGLRFGETAGLRCAQMYLNAFREYDRQKRVSDMRMKMPTNEGV